MQNKRDQLIKGINQILNKGGVEAVADWVIAREKQAKVAGIKTLVNDTGGIFEMDEYEVSEQVNFLLHGEV